jgi:hypothetical protein
MLQRRGSGVDWLSSLHGSCSNPLFQPGLKSAVILRSWLYV